MDFRTISRAALSGCLTALRLPFDAAVQLRGRSAPSSSTKRSVDRAEAAIRDIAGWALGDEELRNDAQPPRIVAQQGRGRAAPLRGEAQRLSEEGLEQMRRRREEAARRRVQAAKRDKARKRRAARERLERRRRAGTQSRSTVASPAADTAAERAQALASQEGALAALREAQRLRRAGKAKGRKPAY